MDALSKYESWVACTIITNAAQREHSNREPAREDCGALRTPDSSAGLNVNAIPAANASASRFDRLERRGDRGFQCTPCGRYTAHGRTSD
jgi:hypothetical protein